MTKKDYVKLAAVLKVSSDADPVRISWIKDIVRELMSVLWEDNHRFDRARFWAACGLKKEEL